MSRYIFDVETNGFLNQLDRLHCLVLKDIDTGEVHSFSSQLVPISPDHVKGGVIGGLKRLMEAEEIVGHNVIGFDIPALKKVYPWFHVDPSKVVDTYVLSRLYEGNVKERDFKSKSFPKQLAGNHSLEAWGHRLGDYKGDYSGGWDAWSEEMQLYCEQDVEVTFKLYKHFLTLPKWPQAELLEHQAQWVTAQIERNGIPFDHDAAVELYGKLIEIRDRMTAELKVLFPPWVVYQGEVISKANNRKTGHTIGAVYSKVLINDFNPQSRDHIISRFKAKYDWQPTKFTDKGKPQVDETILSELPYPEAKPLAELFLILKRTGQVCEGKGAWLALEQNGWIHHRLNCNGAVTGRATHSKPNITQVPKVGSRYGKECRSLFGMIPGVCPWPDGVLYGTDVAGLELRMLAHYMARYDKGAYGKAVIYGTEEDQTDVHSITAKAIGLDPKKVYTINGRDQTGRACGKTFNYGFLYGGGDARLANIIGQPEKKGRAIKRDFLNRLPALKSLREAVEEASKRGYVRAIDGRHMHVRSSHSALNTLLQGAGAVICKAWMVEANRLLMDEGLIHGWDGGDYAILIWAHDELQIACRHPDIARTVDGASKQAIKNVEEGFNIRLPLDVGGKTGVTWRDTH